MLCLYTVNDKIQYYYKKWEKINSGDDDEKNIQYKMIIHKIVQSGNYAMEIRKNSKKKKYYEFSCVSFQHILFGAIETA